MIDFVLARFKIQTKVVVLILPLLFTILAVGATGFYASLLLQTRIEVSNGVVQLLSGFKSVYASIATFLREPNEENFNRASQVTSKQIADIETALKSLDETGDIAALQNAREATHTILLDVREIWKIRSARQKLVADVEKNLNDLYSLQMAVGKSAFKLVNQATQLENKEKSRLRDVLVLQSVLNSLGTLTHQAQSMVPGWSGDQNSPELKRSLADIAKRLSSSSRVFEQNGVDGAGRLAQDIFDFLKEGATHPGSLEAAARERALGNALSEFSASVRGRSQAAIDETISALSNANHNFHDAETVTKKLRSIVSNSSEIKIAFAELLAEPRMDNVKAVERALFVYTGEVDLLESMAAKDPFFGEVPPKVRKIAERLAKNAVDLEANNRMSEQQFSNSADKIDRIWELMSRFADAQKQNAAVERLQANSISIASMVMGLIVAVISGAALVFTLKRPISQITKAMQKLAGGALDASIEGERRGDEIGEMARALTVFRENAAQKIAMQERTEELHRIAEDERERNEHERMATARNIESAVSSLAGGLKNLAGRDLRETIVTPFAGAALDTLRQDFNSTVSDLRSTMRDIRDTSADIQVNGKLLADTAEDLSRRNEQQASSIEQTAAAISEITRSVEHGSEHAIRAAEIVSTVKQEADGSLIVVENAVDAMSRIKDASDRMNSIVAVIDGMAFQTNLLALNAGVEAARAGEAGKGFAVVAHEVRELAQRSASAAKEISALINRSTTEVSKGVGFVEETGKALNTIVGSIGEISKHISQMATSSRDQASNLNEINATVIFMDQMTQQNAAMAVEAGAATRQLAGQVDELMRLVHSFVLDEAASMALEEVA